MSVPTSYLFGPSPGRLGQPRDKSKSQPSRSIDIVLQHTSSSRILSLVYSLSTMSQAFYDDPESLLPEPSAYQPATSADLDQRQGQYQEYIDEHGLTGAGVPQEDDGEEERERLEGLKSALEQVPDEVKKVSWWGPRSARRCVMEYPGKSRSRAMTSGRSRSVDGAGRYYRVINSRSLS